MKTLSYSDVLQGTTQKIDYNQVGKVTSASVHKGTGKDWKYWITVLDKAGARTWSYQEIVACLKKKHRLSPWWQHGVALGFEIAIGRRLEGQDAKGKYMVTATKSVAAAAPRIWKFLLSKEGLDVWLRPLSPVKIAAKSTFETTDGYFGEVRTMKQGRRLRLTWQDPLWEKKTIVELQVVPRPKKSTIFVFNHTGLVDAKTKALLGLRWRKAADQIAKEVLS